jgi:hypothetical protein
MYFQDKIFICDKCIMGFFKKVFSGAKKLFGKVKQGVSDTFKKGGYLQQGLGAVARVGGKIVDVGGKVVGAIEKSPFGVALAPVTGLARAGLGLAGRVVGIAKVGSNALADAQQAVKNKDGVGNIVNNVLEKAKEAQAIAKGPKFV